MDPGSIRRSDRSRHDRKCDSSKQQIAEHLHRKNLVSIQPSGRLAGLGLNAAYTL